MGLLERAVALGDLDRWHDEAQAGQGRLVLVSGEAGVGKSSLLNAFVASVRERRGARSVLWSACDALTTPRPFGPLVDVASALGGRVAALLDAGVVFTYAASELARPELSRSALFGGVLEAMAGRAGPSVLVIEDLHWADEATLAMMGFLGRRIAGTRALIVGTYRHDEVLPTQTLRLVLGDLANVAAVRRLQLPPLSREAVATLAHGSGIDPDHLFEATAGNPFFVTEVMAAGGRDIPAIS